MRESERDRQAPLIERGSPRALFAELVGQAVGDTGVAPSPMATASLIELLEQRVQVSPAGDAEPASLTRSVVSGRYYREMGRSAYGAVAASLPTRPRDRGGPQLFQELADRFGELATVLGEVSDRAHGSRPRWLLGLCERYLTTGSAWDRWRLVRAGCVPPPPGRGRGWQ